MSKRSLLRHENHKTCNKPSETICKKCGREYKTLRWLNLHLEKNSCLEEKKEFICEKCERKFDNEYTFKKHLKRKTPCQRIVGDPTGIISNNQCPFCLREYKSTRSMASHFKICKVKNGEMDEFRQRFIDMENEIITMKEEKACSQNIGGNCEQNTNCHNTQNIIQILNTPETMAKLEKHIGCPINCYNHPNTDYIDKEIVVRNADGSCYRFPEIVKNFTRELYANLDHPENHSIIMIDISRDKLVGLQAIADDGKIGKKWKPLATQELFKTIKSKMEKKFVPCVENKIYTQVSNSIEKRNVQQFDSSVRGLKDTRALIERTIDDSDMLKLEKFKFDIKRLISYNLGQYEPKVRVKKLLSEEWCENAPESRRNIYLKKESNTEYSMVNKWNGDDWDEDLLDSFVATVRNFTKLTMDELDDGSVTRIVRKKLKQNRKFLSERFAIK
ncbi:MAG: hypothetical protein KAS12_04175 [Candidatus Aenigmarchaeota archaeon]|nr:hypothetical protein [Candidatus Aenigmarchaeota archaeon]